MASSHSSAGATSMRSVRKVFEPLAIGAPRPYLGVALEARADDPFRAAAHREGAGEGRRTRGPGRRRARQSRGRDPDRIQGRRARRLHRHGEGDRLWLDGPVGAGQCAELALVPRRHDPARGRGRRQARRRDDPQGRGRLGHPFRRPVPGAARGAARAEEADPRPRDPRDAAGRQQRRGDRRRLAPHARA